MTDRMSKWLMIVFYHSITSKYLIQKVNKETMKVTMKSVPRCVLYTHISIRESEYSEVEYNMLNRM